MASLCLVEEYGNIFNFFFDNCDCNQCNRMDERVDDEAGLELQIMDVEDNLRPKKLKKNQNKETGTSLPVCPTCNKNFSTNKILKRHIKIHSDGKNYQCSEEGCNLSFTRKDNLNTHMRKHTGEKLFSCTSCKKYFASKQSKDRHTKNRNVCSQ